MNIDFNPIIQFLNDMAEKLTPSAQRVFELAVRQTMIDGVLDLFFWLFMLMVTILSLKYTIAIGKRSAEEADCVKQDDLETLQFIFILISLGLSIVLFFMTFEWIPSAISAFINPEYQTLLKLLQLIK